jgi:hypothetical protein
MGMTAIGIIYSPLGQRSGAHFNPAVSRNEPSRIFSDPPCPG